MPGRNNSANKFAFSQYIVGTVLGDGCNYSTVQSAIDDAFAAGGGVVLVKPGTYNENLTLRSGVDLVGADVDGRLPSFLAKVVINGNMTFSAVGGFSIVVVTEMNFTCAAGDLLTMTPTGGAQMIFACKFSGLEATAPGSRAVVFDPDLTSSCSFATDNSSINADGTAFDMIGAGSGSASVTLESVSSNGDVFRLNSGNGSLDIQNARASAGGTIFQGFTAFGNCTFDSSFITSGNECVLFPAGGGQCFARQSTISCSAGSGLWIDGVGGTVEFVDLGFTAIGNGIGFAITQQKLDWQPYAESSAAAVGSFRGTASFDSASFAVTNGFVQATGNIATAIGTDSGVATPIAGVFNIFGGPGITTLASANDIYINSVTYTEQVGNFGANSDEGYWISNGVTATLPATGGLVDGATVEIVCVASPVVVQAGVGQRIFIGNQVSSVAGTASNSADGDVLVLRFRTSGPDWYAVSSIGNWVLA
jgi:hypothetical protein